MTIDAYDRSVCTFPEATGGLPRFKYTNLVIFPSRFLSLHARTYNFTIVVITYANSYPFAIPFEPLFSLNTNLCRVSSLGMHRTSVV